MGRIRSLKPEFFKSRSLARCSLPARFTFQGLWCEADDHGRGVADARLINASTWPLDDDVTSDDVREHLLELARTGHIRLYEADGERYYEILSWEKHQAAAYRRGDALHPLPPAETPQDNITHDQSCKKMQESAGREGKGREGRGTDTSHSLALVVDEPTDLVPVVFRAWQQATGHHRSKLDAKRRRVIAKALKDYGLDEVVDAVRGVKHSPHHMGQNKTRTVYDDIGLILRDAAHIERFRDLERREQPQPAALVPKSWEPLQRLVDERARA